MAKIVKYMQELTKPDNPYYQWLLGGQQEKTRGSFQKK